MTFHVVVGAGPTGTATALLLAESGDDVRVVTRRGTGPKHARIELTAADATSELADLAEGAATLINCAMPPYNRWPEETPALSDGLLHAAERTGAGYVNLSNAYGYGPAGSPLTDDLPLRPTTIKGRVRAQMYRDGLAAHEAGRLRFTEVRPADYLGVGALAMFNWFIGPQVQAGQEVVFPADLDAAHSWTYIGDVAKTLAAVARSQRSWGTAWHTPQTSDMSIREIAARFATIAGRPQPSVREMTALELHTATADPLMAESAEMQYLYQRECVLDWSRTAAELGLEPTPLDDVLRELAAAA
ncbi:NAD-dependent epimerase/dehydratase family protein [Dactylosporangium matsuzakiense]|uniref:NAD-dependent epimerase n=1 Tax=Dactylosporangium matsuzakiense TaxID=53360 RepID=A0A9W6KGI8_9ACTN|nr:NAD-dependent epimerase/dehydratase family protein [Dactylosporangium matsuzakiense]UWZ44086.1 NAD-dependent epimerase/dehydratase family protein [Dactylosporangium matsuzakiense]GLL00783.1 NAD-dependent epimerase [Dactylosporangium matsuzakiense]